MTSEPSHGMAAIRYTVEPSSPLSSAPPSPLRKRSITPTPNDTLPDTETTSKMSNLGLDGNDPPPKKRAKLTPAEKAEREREKEERKREKEEKEREKARTKAEREEQKRLKDEEKVKKDLERAADKAKREEEKAKREEEKAKRDEEKAKKDAEKAKKDAEKAKKEEEKAKKEEEKAKKERAQLRMDNFFIRKPPSSLVSASGTMAPVATPSKSEEAAHRLPTPSRGKVASAAIPTTISVPCVPEIEMADGAPVKNDYIKTFHPFFVRAGVILAPLNNFWQNEAPVEQICRRLDECLVKAAESSDEMDIDVEKVLIPNKLPPAYFESVFALPPSKRRRGNIPKLSTKQILAGLNSSPGPVPSIFGGRKSNNIDYLAQFKKLPRKVLKYAEDVRPAYRGTFTKVPTTSGLRKGRNPFQQSLPGIQYDYDSEAEWVQEPDDDGEDIVSEEDEDPVEAGSADEMDDFLDDEEDLVKKRNTVAGPLIPATSGLMWDGECPKSEELMAFKIGILIEGGTIPINPFSQEYWIMDKRKLVPPTRAMQSTPGSEEKGKAKVQGGNWWNATSQRSQAPGPMAPPTSGPAAPLTQDLNGQSDIRYGQSIPPPRNALYAGYDRSSSAKYMPTGAPYSSWVVEPAAKLNVAKIEADGNILPLSSLIDPKIAFSLGIAPEVHYQYFMLWHHLDYCGMSTYAGLEQCHDFIVGNDATKVAMLEALKRQFNFLTKPMLKHFMDTYCNRVGNSSVKHWRCVFKKDENSYWTVDTEAYKFDGTSASN